MDLKQAQVLITGGSEGIGLGLAQRYLQAGSRVMITGRSADKLQNAKIAFPGLEIFVNDIGIAGQRQTLYGHVETIMPGINILINNAGIQRRVGLAVDDAEWAKRQAEIDILLSAPVHLNHLLIPVILAHGRPSAIVNVTSGGGYIPQVFAPVYSACKAAIHSYTMTLRHALAGTNCKVVELVPPAVQTALAGPGVAHGATLDDFCDAVFRELAAGKKVEVGFGPTKELRQEINGQDLKEIFAQSAKRFPVNTY
jgi:uncharacterized oxidoreductase